MKQVFLLTVLHLLLTGISAAPASAQDSLRVSLIRVDGSISPTTTNYITRGIRTAREQQMNALIIELDTPGGLLESTKNIVQALLDSDDLPVIVYVSPDGASAASAGTFITMAAHVAAMAPATNIGAASPVQIAPGGTAQTDTVMQKKIFNYSESYIETIANRRGRNAEWAIAAVRNGESITAQQALELNVIDLIADTREDLLQQVNGRIIEGDTLHTAGAVITEIPTNLAENFLGFILRPEVMLILTMIAIYGIIGEVTNPGAIVPGVAGVIALILVLYASAAMPINIAGFVLIGLAIMLFIAEAFTPTFGLLVAGGAVSFFLGALMLFQDLPDSMALSWEWVLPATLLTALFFVWIAGAGLKIQFAESRTGKETMIGRLAQVTDDTGPQGGRVFLNGEYWNAVSDEPLREGDFCEVKKMEGLTLQVAKLETREAGNEPEQTVT